mmetsp:Transcript_2708/g.5592  ORF Transcript_2708/g.5592 Transcript_2708/m.5592 type:complete len:121 (+) Transcript_2708:305-667(+)
MCPPSFQHQRGHSERKEGKKRSTADPERQTHAELDLERVREGGNELKSRGGISPGHGLRLIWNLCFLCLFAVRHVGFLFFSQEWMEGPGWCWSVRVLKRVLEFLWRKRVADTPYVWRRGG